MQNVQRALACSLGLDAKLGLQVKQSYFVRCQGVKTANSTAI